MAAETDRRGVAGAACERAYDSLSSVKFAVSTASPTQPRLRIEHVCEDLKALIRARERNPIFEHETGYMWSIEQGGKTGSFHVHAMFFFKGHYVDDEWRKGLEIAQLWAQITRRWGYTHVCRRTDYKKPGVGPIKRNDPKAYDNVMEAVRYLAKDDQHLQIKPWGARTMATGQL